MHKRTADQSFSLSVERGLPLEGRVRMQDHPLKHRRSLSSWCERLCLGVHLFTWSILLGLSLWGFLDVVPRLVPGGWPL